MPQPPSNLLAHFSILPDPREGNRRHLLHDILVMSFCGVIGGADSWVEVAEFAEAKEEWFRTFLELPHGVPSHDTFSRVFRLLDPDQFHRCFQRWVHAVHTATRGAVIPIDGKTLRGSFDTATAQSPIHLLSAWASENRLLLGQVKVNEKSNEITAIPELLRLLNIRGCIVTIDAMGTQKAIAAQIVEQGGDYVLSLKGNHPLLHEAVALRFAQWEADGFHGAEHDLFEEVERGHGRVEKRTVISTPQVAWLEQRGDWAGLASLVQVTRVRQVGTKRSEETSFYLSSCSGRDAKVLAHAIRRHWSIENELHWGLDVAFGEDACRVHKDYGPENLALIRRIAINLLQQDQSVKAGIKTKRRRAGWDPKYLIKILGFPHMR